MQTRRRGRAETNAENEAAVLAAARDHFERFGYHGASVEAIAEQAGFSKGVVYSRYRTRDELFLAVLASSIEDRQREVDEQVAGQGGADLRSFIVAQSTRTLGWQSALVEFRIHASRHPELNDRYRALHETAIDNVARTLAGVIEQTGIEPPRAVRQLAIAGLAGATGVVVERLVNPDVDVHALLQGIGEVFGALPVAPKEN